MRTALVWIGFAVTVVFAYFAVRGVHAREVWDALRTSSDWWLLPSLAALALAVGIRAVRWRLIFEPGRRPPQGAVTRALLIGYLFNNVLPARAGEAARVVALHQRTGTSRAEAAGTIVSERLYDVLALLVLFFCCLPWFPHVARVRVALVLVALVVGTLVVAALVLARFGSRPLRLLLRPLEWLPFAGRLDFDRAAGNAAAGLASLRRFSLGSLAFALTLLSWLTLALSAWLVLPAFGLDLSPLAGLLVVIATGLAMILPSSPAALGVFEGATLVALGSYGVSSSVALSYAIVLHAVNFFPYLVAGAIALRVR